MIRFVGGPLLGGGDSSAADPGSSQTDTSQPGGDGGQVQGPAAESITLSRTDRKVELPPVIEPTISSFSGIAHPGDPVKLKLQVFNADGGTAEYEVSDFNGKIIHSHIPVRYYRQ